MGRPAGVCVDPAWFWLAVQSLKWVNIFKAEEVQDPAQHPAASSGCQLGPYKETVFPPLKCLLDHLAVQIKLPDAEPGLLPSLVPKNTTWVWFCRKILTAGALSVIWFITLASHNVPTSRPRVLLTSKQSTVDQMTVAAFVSSHSSDTVFKSGPISQHMAAQTAPSSCFCSTNQSQWAQTNKHIRPLWPPTAASSSPYVSYELFLELVWCWC